MLLNRAAKSWTAADAGARTWWRAATVLLTAGAAAWAVFGSKWLFPYLSVNHDEAVYRLQADALFHGHLFPVAPAQHYQAFQPWLSAYRNGHFIPKYAPVHASVLAAGRWLTGTDRAGLGIIAAGAVLATFAVARQVLEDERWATVACGLLAASPLFFLQSATFLTYTTGYTLLALLAACLLKAARSGRSGWFWLSGLIGGLAFFARSFDLVLFGAPLVIGLVLWTVRNSWASLWRSLVLMGAGALGPVLALAWFNRQATGHWLRSPFGLLDASDSIGFGPHRIYPNDPYLHFTPQLGLLGLLRNMALTGFWCFGGLVLIGLAVFAVLRAPRPSRRIWAALAAAGLAIPLGYFFFWGSYGAILFGAPRYLGPYYYMPVLLPVVVLGCAGLRWLVRWDGVVAVLAILGMLGISTFVEARTVGADLSVTSDNRHLFTGLDHAHLRNALVFLPPLGSPYLLLGFGTAMNSYGYGGPVVYALDEGQGADRAVAQLFPRRRAYRLVVTGTFRQDPPDAHLSSHLVPLAT